MAVLVAVGRKIILRMKKKALGRVAQGVGRVPRPYPPVSAISKEADGLAPRPPAPPESGVKQKIPGNAPTESLMDS